MRATGTAQARGKFGVTPNSAPRTDAEIRAVETYVRLKAAEADLRSSIQTSMDGETDCPRRTGL